jgi:dipeptidase E
MRMLYLEAADPAETAAAVRATDLVWVAGGRPIFLLQHARASASSTSHELGSSTGSSTTAGDRPAPPLATRDLATFRGPDDPGVVDHTTGLALVTCYPLENANRGRQQRYAQLIAAHPEREFVTLTDDQALIVTGNSWPRTS